MFQADIAIVGLAVMGENLALNLEIGDAHSHAALIGQRIEIRRLSVLGPAPGVFLHRARQGVSAGLCGGPGSRPPGATGCENKQ